MMPEFKSDYPSCVSRRTNDVLHPLPVAGDFAQETLWVNLSPCKRANGGRGPSISGSA
jgi:hypothetical protein